MNLRGGAENTAFSSKFRGGAIDVFVAPNDRAPVAVGEHVSSSPLAESTTKDRIAKKFGCGASEIVHVTSFEEEARIAVANQLAQTSDVGTEHGLAHRHGFERLE